MKKKHGDHIESFGVRHSVGDVVGCFLDAETNCISKNAIAKTIVIFVSRCNLKILI